MSYLIPCCPREQKAKGKLLEAIREGCLILQLDIKTDLQHNEKGKITIFDTRVHTHIPQVTNLVIRGIMLRNLLRPWSSCRWHIESPCFYLEGTLDNLVCMSLDHIGLTKMSTTFSLNIFGTRRRVRCYRNDCSSTLSINTQAKRLYPSPMVLSPKRRNSHPFRT